MKRTLISAREPWGRAGLVLSLTVSAVIAAACVINSPASPSPAKGSERAERQVDDQVSRQKPQRDRTEYTSTSGQPTATRAQLRERAMTTDDLTWLPAAPAIRTLLPGVPILRTSAIQLKSEASAAEARSRANAVLASEALTRASFVVRHWLDKRDPVTGLLTHPHRETRMPGWFYEDTGSDLFPHITIGAYFLFPDRYGEMLSVLAAERRLGSTSSSLPADLLLPDGQQASSSEQARMFGAAEYAKDGLLPLVERLGADPWLGRLRELADGMIGASTTPTRQGPIPAGSNEVNGDALQVLTRTYWATGDTHYYFAADRIARAYLEDMLPKTEGLPAHEWKFLEGEPVGPRRLRLSDHGNEIIAGLVTWHLAESQRGEPQAMMHRVTIRKMLDRMLASGRNPDGLWYRVMNIPSGEVDQEGLSDNFGYVFQAYMLQAFIERTLLGGDLNHAERYEEATRTALRALPKYAYYPWQRGAMDGFADSVEGALSLMSRYPDADAERWVDEQIAVLFSFQRPDGLIEDNYLDGNFVRTSLLYAHALTGGTRLDPWRPDLLVGATLTGTCVQLVLGSAEPWAGTLKFDTPRHSEQLHLPADFPRLNEWTESFTAATGQEYVVDGPTVLAGAYKGEQLAAGIPLRLQPSQSMDLRVCPRVTAKSS
ncbi:MAG: hypothetical protein ACKVVP_06030 [Chloroflexota bacterium]